MQGPPAIADAPRGDLFSAQAAIPAPTGRIDPFDVFDPPTDTILPGGTHTFDEVRIRAGVTVTATGNITITVANNLDIAGALKADCFGIALHVKGDLSITGAVDNSCSGDATNAGDLVILTYGGYMDFGEADTRGSVGTSGDLKVSDDPDLEDWELDVLPFARSSTALSPVCSAEADRLAGIAISDFPMEVAFYGNAADPDGGPVSYAWNFGDGASGAGREPIHEYAIWGSVRRRAHVDRRRRSDLRGRPAHRDRRWRNQSPRHARRVGRAASLGSRGWGGSGLLFRQSGPAGAGCHVSLGLRRPGHIRGSGSGAYIPGSWPISRDT